MIEVLFGESEAGAMRCARLESDEFKDHDVVCLGFLANVGDIKRPFTGEYRSQLISKLLYQEQWGADAKMKRELDGLGAVYAKELDRLLGEVRRGEPARVWFSDAPYSVCGLLWLCDTLSTLKAEMYVVKLPHTVSMAGGTVSFNSWGEVEPRLFEKFLPLQKELSPLIRGHNSFKWKKLQEENSPVRAVINGNVISVPANFYDFLIWKHLGSSPIKEAALIGEILGKNPIGIGDWWLAYRIDHLISKGKIKAVEDNERKYARMIKRA